MADLGNFDASEHEPASFEPMPAGEYVAIATASEWKDTKAGTGQYLEITWEVIEGDHKGRKLWSRLNLKNPSDKAVEIASRELADIGRAVDLVRLNDSAQFHNVPVTLRVAIREWNGEKRNEVKGVKAAKAGTAAPEKPAGNVKPPWAAR